MKTSSNIVRLARGLLNCITTLRLLTAALLVGFGATTVSAAMIDSFGPWNAEAEVELPTAGYFESGQPVALRFSAHQPPGWALGTQMSASIIDDDGNRLVLAPRQRDPFGWLFLGGTRHAIEVSDVATRTYTLHVRIWRGSFQSEENRTVTIRRKPWLHLETAVGKARGWDDSCAVRAGSSFYLRVRLSCPLGLLGVTSDFTVRLRSDRRELMLGLPETVRFRPTQTEQTFRIHTVDPASAFFPISGQVSIDKTIEARNAWVDIFQQPHIDSIELIGKTPCNGGILRIRGSSFRNPISPRNIRITRVGGSSMREPGGAPPVSVLEGSGVHIDPGPVVPWDNMTINYELSHYDNAWGTYQVTIDSFGLVSNGLNFTLPESYDPVIEDFRVVDSATGNPARLKESGVVNRVTLHWSARNFSRVEIYVSQLDGSHAGGRLGRHEGLIHRENRTLGYTSFCDLSSGSFNDRLGISAPTVVYTIKAYWDDADDRPTTRTYEVTAMDTPVASPPSARGFRQIQFFNCGYPHHRPVSIWYNTTAGGGVWSSWTHLTTLSADVSAAGTCFTGIVPPAALELHSGLIYDIRLVDPGSDTCGFVGHVDDPRSANCVIWNEVIRGDDSGPEYPPVIRY